MKHKDVILGMGIMLICLGNINSIQAQGGKIGLRFMPTFTSFEIYTPDDEVIKGEFTLGYGYGGLLALYFSEHFGFQGEIIYNSLAQKYSRAEFGGKVKLQYINIPLLLSYNTGLKDPVNLNIVAGPQIGLNVGSDFNRVGQDTYQALFSVRNSDIGLAYGAGVDFGLNSAQNFRLALGFRGVLGLIDISENSGTRETDSYYVLRKTKLNTYAGYIGLSYLF